MKKKIIDIINSDQTAEKKHLDISIIIHKAALATVIDSKADIHGKKVALDIVSELMAQIEND